MLLTSLIVNVSVPSLRKLCRRDPFPFASRCSYLYNEVMNMHDAIVVWEGINSILAAELRFTFVLFGRGHSVALLAKSVSPCSNSLCLTPSLLPFNKSDHCQLPLLLTVARNN